MRYFLVSWEKGAFLFYPAEALVQRCSVKKMFLEISQNSQENNCARVSFLIKLQASHFWIPFFLIVEVSFLHILYEFQEIKLNVMKYTLNCEIVWKKYYTVYPRLNTHRRLTFFHPLINSLLKHPLIKPLVIESNATCY